jgi:hypothetical protein
MVIETISGSPRSEALILVETARCRRYAASESFCRNKHSKVMAQITTEGGLWLNE